MERRKCWGRCRMKIGDVTINSGFFYNKYLVLVEIKKNYKRRVEFRSFENAEIVIISKHDGMWFRSVMFILKCFENERC